MTIFDASRVHAFRVRKNVICNATKIDTSRSSHYVVIVVDVVILGRIDVVILGSDSSGGCGLRNAGGVSRGWRRDAARCAAVLACIQPDNQREFAAARVNTKSSAHCCAAATSPQLCTRSPPSRAAACMLSSVIPS
jgi:hypothetical protein